MALLAPSDTSSEIGGHVDKNGAKFDPVNVDVGERKLLKGLRDWKMKFDFKQKMDKQKLNGYMKDARKALVNYSGERTPQKLH
jgi:hypothetical protein